MFNLSIYLFCMYLKGQVMAQQPLSFSWFHFHRDTMNWDQVIIVCWSETTLGIFVCFTSTWVALICWIFSILMFCLSLITQNHLQGGKLKDLESKTTPQRKASKKQIWMRAIEKHKASECKTWLDRQTCWFSGKLCVRHD